MITTWLWILLGVIQGILEWLPVSSEGQIFAILVFLGNTNPAENIKYAFWLHLGTAGAVLVYYRKEFSTLLRLQTEEAVWLWKFLILTVLGTVVAAVPIRLLLINFIPTSLGVLINLGVALLLVITGYLIGKWEAKGMESFRDLSGISSREMILAGVIQGFAALPGVSRSGFTITYFLEKRFTSDEAFRGSFWMSVPASLGAVTLEIILAMVDGEPILPEEYRLGIFLGVITAFIVGFASLSFFIRLAQKYSFSRICYLLATLIILGVVIENVLTAP